MLDISSIEISFDDQKEKYVLIDKFEGYTRELSTWEQVSAYMNEILSDNIKEARHYQEDNNTGIHLL